MRVVLMGFVIVLLVLSCGMAFRYNQDASYSKEELDNERYKRMIAEESLQEAGSQISTLSSQLKRMESKFNNTEIALDRTKAINTDLKNRLDKAARIQTSLDQKITELQQMASPL